MIVEKCSRTELILYEILKNPCLFGEFLYNIDRPEEEKPFELSIYQKEYLCDFSDHVSFRAARSVGKTLAESAGISWALIYNIFPDDYIVYTVPNKNHLEPVFTNLTRMFRTNTIMKYFIEPKGGINGSEYSITLLNHAKLICRIAGQSGGGVNVNGLHSPYEFVDEAGFYPWGTWAELQPTLNTWQQGYRLSVAGVPIGLRENNVLYYTDEISDIYSKHRTSALENPRFTEEDHQRAIEQCGGKDSEDYAHFILGQHGRPVFALFDRATMDIQVYPVYKIEVDGIRESKNLITNIISKISMLPGLPDKNAECLFGVDLGYTEATALLVLYLDEYRRIKFHARIKLTKVSYPIQEKIIDALDSKFNPVLIGIDKGSAGISVIQNLLERKEYLHKDYKKRIFPYDFASSIIMGMDSEGKEIKEKAKPLSVSTLQEYTNNKKIIYSSTDMDMIIELERMTYTKSPAGDIAYKTLTSKGGKRGEDHFTSALLCATISFYLTNDFSMKKEKKKLFRPSWV